MANDENDMLTEDTAAENITDNEENDNSVSDGEETADNSDGISESEEATEAEKESVPEKGINSRRNKYHAPLYIATCIFLAAVIFFGVKLVFFNTDITGTWGLSVKTLDGSDTMKFNLSFDDNTARLQSGGTVYIGRLTTKEDDGSYLKDDNGNPMIMLNMNLNSRPFVYKFNYEFEGNIITGRTLKLTDITGLFYAPDQKTDNSDESKKRKKNTGYVERDDKVYYVWSLTPSQENAIPKKPDKFKVDDKLSGSWLYKTEETAFPYTWTFYKDGIFEQNSNELELHGIYQLDGDKLTVSWSGIGGEQKVELKYKADNNKLTLAQEYEGTVVMERELKKTKDKYDFKDGTE